MLDGVRRIDPLKTEAGVEKTYRFPDGYGPKGGPAEMKVTFRPAGIANTAFQAALAELTLSRPDLVEKRASLRSMMDDADFMGCLHDHVVIRWSTTLQVGGETMDPTRDNFIALMRYTHEWSESANDAGLYAPEVALVTLALLNDVFDASNFYAERKAAQVKN